MDVRNESNLQPFISLLMLFQENYYWLDRILRSYQSRMYSGDVGISFEVGGCNCVTSSFFIDKLTSVPLWFLNPQPYPLYPILMWEEVAFEF
jgi:hypothetical protein